MAYSNLYGRFYASLDRSGAALVKLWRFSPSRWYLAGILVLQALAWLESLFIYRNLGDKLLVLHYNVDFGIDLVGAPGQIFWYPWLGLAVLAVNMMVAAGLHQQRDGRPFIHFLLSTAVIFHLFLDLALFFVYLINFR
ncbi:MAG: hypothetical protein WC453_03085 [Patescibacteria group bacterium]